MKDKSLIYTLLVVLLIALVFSPQIMEKFSPKKEYLITFEDNTPINIGKSKKDILNKKREKWHTFLKEQNIIVIEEYDYMPIILVEMSERKAKKIKKDSIVKSVLENKE